MYATTERGWLQQRKKASQDLGSAIAKTVRNGFLSTQSDVLRQHLEVCVGSRIPKCTFPPDILDKIQKGGLASNRIEPRFKRALKRFLNIP
jgi:hypothetical protein